MTQDFEELLDTIQGKAQKLMGICMYEKNNRGLELAGDICTIVATYRESHKMAQEVECLEGLDLSALSVDLQAEHPEHDMKGKPERE